MLLRWGGLAEGRVPRGLMSWARKYKMLPPPRFVYHNGEKHFAIEQNGQMVFLSPKTMKAILEWGEKE